LGGPVLCPGLGAQGGDPAQLRRLFADVGGVVLPSSSRDILRHGPDVGSLRAAARTVADDLIAATPATKSGDPCDAR